MYGSVSVVANNLRKGSNASRRNATSYKQRETLILRYCLPYILSKPAA